MYSDLKTGHITPDFESNYRIEKFNEFNEFKSSFLRMLSHEIRTPMNSIIGFTDLLNEDCFSRDDRLLFVNTIKDSSLNLLNVLEELIDLAELETNQVKLYESACSLCGLFSDLLSYGENLKLKRKKYNVSFQINNNIITDNLSILTDIKCLRKVLVILLDNAIKYTDNGFIDFGYVIRDDKNLLFYVIDSGSGIPEEYQDNVFIKSNSFENNSSVFHNGLGVGLTIAKGIINILGGDVWFNSRSSEGTSFFFSLPFKKHENYNEVKSIHRDSSINRSNRAAC